MELGQGYPGGKSHRAMRTVLGAIWRGFHRHRCTENLLLSIINMCGILQRKFHLSFDNFTHRYNVSCSYISSTVSSHCPQLVPFQPSCRLFCVISFCVSYTGMELLKRQKASQAVAGGGPKSSHLPLSSLWSLNKCTQSLLSGSLTAPRQCYAKSCVGGPRRVRLETT